jgi:hypothetical protein
LDQAEYGGEIAIHEVHGYAKDLGDDTHGPNTNVQDEDNHTLHNDVLYSQKYIDVDCEGEDGLESNLDRIHEFEDIVDQVYAGMNWQGGLDEVVSTYLGSKMDTRETLTIASNQTLRTVGANVLRMMLVVLYIQSQNTQHRSEQ